MSVSAARLLRQFQRHPLAAWVIAIFSLAAPEIGSCVAVLNCNDVGPNSLRAAIANTPSGGTVDMTTLTCSTITLEDLQIVIPQQDLTILGPPAGVTIAHDGSYDRVLNHQGSGLLRLGNLTITGGNPYSNTHDVYGGCIYSKGNVELSNSSVTSCFADADGNHQAEGGGIFTVGLLTLDHSTLSGNVAGHLAGVSTYGAFGGGAFVSGYFEALYSSVRGNSANGRRSVAGGVRVNNGVYMSSSTISGNSAENVAGLCACGVDGGTATIENSTISGNHATNIVGGIYSTIPTTMRNSTIAFNTAANRKAYGYYVSPGLATNGGFSNIHVDLESSILSSNTYTSNASTIENDFSARNGDTISGNANLIVASLTSFAPGVVAVTACPLLGQLRDNGGPTQTHALLSHSPAIDQGNNSQHFVYDQRGSPYKRADGGLFVHYPDIGAYEVQLEDVVFNSGFDSCP